MKVLIAPDSYKGSISAIEFCQVAETCLKKYDPRIKVKKLPMADGGEGTVDAIVDYLHGQKIKLVVHDPLMKTIVAEYGYIKEKGLAVIEMASASGLPLINKEELNPMISTTYGTGELIKDALERGCKKILLGIGGSATNDGGIGARMALGGRFYDQQGLPVDHGCAGCLQLSQIDLSGLDPRLEETEIVIACDVDNLLYGQYGASYVYGPQKGATDDMLPMLDQGLQNMSQVIYREFGKDISSLKGGGAAGGFGAGFFGMLGATIRSGFDMVDEIIQISKMLEEDNYDLIITGEGQINDQTLNGKLPLRIARIGKSYNIPVVCIVGTMDNVDEAIYDQGMTAVFSIMDKPMTLAEAMASGKEKLEVALNNITRLFYKRV